MVGGREADAAGTDGRGRAVKRLSPERFSAAYSWYALSILVLCYLFNYIDRNILSILAEDVKRDLGLSDSSIGFLYGTAFAVFYAVFGIPFGRLADAWIRKNLIAIGLFFWSLMTALTGTAGTFPLLAAYRVGVGVGEASLSPSAYSLIFDMFPARLRATALSIYSGGIYLGAAIGFALGGLIVDTWNRWYPDVSLAPFGLAAWKVAFFAVGLPGVLMSIWVWTLREPPKGGHDGAPVRPVGRPQPLREFAAVVPGLTLLSLWQSGAGARGLAWNVAGAAALGVGAWLFGLAAGTPAQWYALAVGLYAAMSWAQGLRVRERQAFDSLLGNRAFITGVLGFGTMSFVTNGLAFWTAPFLLRSFGASPTRVGALMGIGAAVGGWIGVAAGGLLSDKLKAKRPTGRVDVALLSVALSVPIYYLMTSATTLMGGFFGFLAVVATASLWLGPGAATANELVPAHLRSTGSAMYLLTHTFIGFALGPFTIGKISDALAKSGQAPGEALGNAMFLSSFFWVVSVTLLLMARGQIGPAEARLAAAAAGAETASRA
jgi:MFS family permease